MTVDEALRRIERRAVPVSHDNGFDEWYYGSPGRPQDVAYSALFPEDLSRLCRALREAVAGLSKEAYREGTGPVENSWDSPWSAREARETLARVARLLAGEEEGA